jgi:MazG family protein
MDKLLAIMAQLRHPESGCPWDLQQNFASIAPYTIEEAYEVADAIERQNYADLRDELGDLLLQVVFHAQMADEAGHFDFQQVVEAISSKMVRRHPHVFGSADIATAEAQTVAWEEAKASERAERGASSLMDEIAGGLPELVRARKVQRRAASAGFDWAQPGPVLDKLEEELQELRAAFRAGQPADIEDELGDLMFAAVNFARQLGLDPGRALSQSTRKFERRFRAMEQHAGGAAAFAALRLDEQEAHWQQVKQAEKRSDDA